MAHFISLQEAVELENGLEVMGRFIDNPPPNHKCIPECHTIGGEPETPEMYE